MQKDINEFKTRFLFSLILCIPLLYLSMGIHIGIPAIPLPDTFIAILQFILTTGILAAGYPFYKRGILSVLKTYSANMDTLIALSTASAYFYSLYITIRILIGAPGISHMMLYYETAGVLLTFILFGRWLESVTRKKTMDSVTKLLQLQPDTATVIRDGVEQEIPAAEVVINDIIIIKSGQRIPVDGIITDGYSGIDESMITGESIPAEKSAGDTVIAGTINTTGTFKFRAVKVGNETMLSRIISMVQETQDSKPPVQNLSDTISSYFVPAILMIAVVSFILWYFAAGYPFSFSLKIFIAVLIIACPCSLGLAIPTAVVVGAGLAAKSGILVKDSAVFQSAEHIDTIVFDKTGTLTTGAPKVIDCIILPHLNEQEIFQYIASIEKRVTHPISTAITSYLSSKNVKSGLEFQEFSMVPGNGIIAVIDNDEILIGNKPLMMNKSVNIDAGLNNMAKKFSLEGKTVIWVSLNKESVAILTVSDTVKPDAKDIIAALHRQHISTILLTGDNKIAAETIGSRLGINTVISEVLPQDKINEIKKLQAHGHKVMMVGDGINDAPALSQAEIGVAIGSGADIALESGNVILIKSRLSDILMLLRLSRFTMKKIRQNLFWAFFYNVISIPIAAGALYPVSGFILNPMIAGLAMSLSSVSVTLNSLLGRGKFR